MAERAGEPLTVEDVIVGLLRTKDPVAIPEFTLDGETWFRIYGVSSQAEGNVTLEVEPW